MLRKFKVNIDGKEYKVEFEELGGVPQQTAPAPLPQHPETAVTTQAAQPASTPAPVASTKDAMTAPMPGSILDICIKVGDQVSQNQVLLILEAMKMENEIVAPKNGTVTAIHVQKGETVDVGRPMVTIE